MSPIAWTANGLWPYWVFRRVSLPFLPSHTVCDPANTFFCFNTNTHTWRHKHHTHPQIMKLTLSLWWQLPVLTKRSIIHLRSSLVPLGTENLSHCCQGQKVIVCFLVILPYPSLSPLFLYPPSLSWNKHFKTPCLMLHTRQISSIRLVSNLEGIQMGPWGKSLSPPFASCPLSHASKVRKMKSKNKYVHYFY